VSSIVGLARKKKKMKKSLYGNAILSGTKILI
jgi:hypothetical protein